MVRFRAVRLVLSSLRRRGVDIIRHWINELAFASLCRSWLLIRGLHAEGLDNSPLLINERQSQNHS